MRWITGPRCAVTTLGLVAACSGPGPSAPATRPALRLVGCSPALPEPLIDGLEPATELGWGASAAGGRKATTVSFGMWSVTPASATLDESVVRRAIVPKLDELR